MPLDDVFETTRGGNDDLRTRTQVELLLFDRALYGVVSIQYVTCDWDTYTSDDGHASES